MGSDIRRARNRAGPSAAVDVVIDRRRFLLLVGAAAAYVSLRPRLGWARHLPPGSISLQSWTLPAEAQGAPADVARSLIGAAVLAPSHWNAQPWRFESEQNSVRI